MPAIISYRRKTSNQSTNSSNSNISRERSLPPPQPPPPLPSAEPIYYAIIRRADDNDDDSQRPTIMLPPSNNGLARLPPPTSTNGLLGQSSYSGTSSSSPPPPAPPNRTTVMQKSYINDKPFQQQRYPYINPINSRRPYVSTHGNGNLELQRLTSSATTSTCIPDLDSTLTLNAESDEVPEEDVDPMTENLLAASPYRQYSDASTNTMPGEEEPHAHRANAGQPSNKQREVIVTRNGRAVSVALDPKSPVSILSSTEDDDEEIGGAKPHYSSAHQPFKQSMGTLGVQVNGDVSNVVRATSSASSIGSTPTLREAERTAAIAYDTPSRFSRARESLARALRRPRQLFSLFRYPGWWKRRTSIERYLIIVLLIFCCLLGALSAALFIVAFAGRGVVPSVVFRPSYVNYSTSSSHDNVCNSAGCITAAARILESIDPKIKPCDDFYEFACSGWSKTRVIPEDMSRYSVFTAIREALEVALKRVLEAEERSDEPASTRKAKRVYKACMNETAIDSRGEEPALIMLKTLVGWPVILPDLYNETAFDWQKSVARLRADGADLLLSMGVWADSRNSSRYVIYVDQPGVGMPSTEYMLRGLDDKYVQGYYQYMIDIAALFNATSNAVKAELRDVLNFEIDLAKIKTPREERRNDTKMYNKMTIIELTKLIPAIRWKEYFDVVMPAELNVTADEEIVVKEPEFFIRLVELVNKTDKRVLANYLGWRTIQSVVWDLDVRFRNVLLKYKKVLYGTLKDRERWRSCVQASANFFDMAVGRLYVTENFNGHSKAVAEEMIKDIRDSFDDLLIDLDWMDDEARLVAKEKAAAVKEKIGFPDFIMNVTALDEFFNGTVADEFDHFGNVLNNSRVWNYKFLSELRKPFDKERWSTGPAVVNAFYSTDNNAITFPAGILQPPFFSKDQPKSMNFGGIGMVIGHELTHGFDDQGRQKDKDGNLRQWWPTSTIEKFEKKAQCIIGQYANFSVAEVNMTLNGVNTQGENIADNGGLKQAYRAYHKWLARQDFTVEPKLPGLPYSNEQLFFINYAMVWCGIYRPDAYVNQILSGVHSPGKYRVIGPLSNSKEFSEAFNCPLGSPMNPEKKCRVW